MPRILITGANRGLGLEFTRQYSADGWDVIACCRTPDSAEELQALAAEQPNIVIETLDVSDFNAIDALAEKHAGQAIDILLNNAGIIGPFPTDEHIARQNFGTMDFSVFEDVMRTNTYAPAKMAEAFIEHVAASEQKKIINISSSVGSIGEMIVPAIAYASSKSALNRAMTIIASQIKDRGVIIGLFCPGYVKTRMDTYGYATVEIEESISLLRPMFDKLTIEDTGCYLGHDGRVIPW